ncbi:TIGR04372 family glycosyltransferase [Candidatus Woesearchaeota archaeon]|nr:TIGR04372 family glycosyltransferase [Candidatus Woesearchaeota archaeon]
MNLFLIPAALILFVIRAIFGVIFVAVDDLRIGHLAGKMEVFLRRLNLKRRKKRIRYIGITGDKPCNRQLLEMFKREIKIVEIPHYLFSNVIFQTFYGNYSILNRMGLFKDLYFNKNEYLEFNHGNPSLKFTEAEEKKGKELLKKMGITEKDWFVCFHARDSAYLKNALKTNCSGHNYRDWDINNAVKAMKYVASRGGFAIRMGHIVEKKLPHLNNPRIIDYASEYRTDFGDIYLPAKCRFFVGDGCGINMVARIFNRPLIFVNKAPSAHFPCSKSDLFIMKKIWSIDKGRFLSEREVCAAGIHSFSLSKQYERSKIRLVDNTPNEITDIITEMNKRLEGSWKTKKEDEDLQKKFKSLFKKNCPFYGFPSRIGSKFLKENRQLLS